MKENHSSSGKSTMNPMRPHQVRDILENLERCHTYLANYYHKLAKKSPEIKCYQYRLLSANERNIVHSLKEFTCQNQKGVLDSYVRFIKPVEIPHLEPRIQCVRPLDEQPEALDVAEKQIQTLCSQMSTADTGPSVRALFENIAELELNRLRQRSQHLALDNDL